MTFTVFPLSGPPCSFPSATLARRIFSVAGVLVLGALRLQGQAPGACPPATHIAIASGTFSSQPGVSFRLTHFVATMEPRGKTAPGCYQKDTVMTHGEIFISNDSLTRVFSSKLEGSSQKIKDFKIENGVGKVTLRGSITKLVPIAFTIAGPVTTDGTSLLLDASQIKADGIPVKALLSMVGEHLSAILKLQGVPGVSVNGNTMVFSPEQIAHLRGHIDSTETTSEGLMLRYGKAPGHKAEAQKAAAK